MPPQTAGATRSSLVDPQGRPLVIQGQLLGPAVSNADFSPGQPITPVREEPVRVWDFPVGVNTQITPRANSAFGFAALRAFANVELVRMAIETRKDQIERLEWQIKPRGDDGRKKNAKTTPKADALTKFWRKPGFAGGKLAPFSTWLRVALEDMLAIDAPAFEKRRNRGGELIGLDIVPGDTIKVLTDETGRLPLPPYPAYQQIIKGRVWADLTTEELLYEPRNPRPNHVMGFSPVEQIIVTIHTIINRQAGQLAYFTEGNTPRGFLNAPDGATPQQIALLQTWLNGLTSGNMAEKAKTIFAPFGSKLQALKDPPLKDDFDEWLARIVAYAFSLPPTPFIKQMNRSTGQTDADRSMEEGLEPLKLWVKRLIDGVNEDDFGVTDHEFAWVDTPEIDPAKQAEIDNINLRNGSGIIDEVRDGRGLDPLPDGLGSKPMIITTTGVMLLSQAVKAAEDALNPVEPPQPLPDNEAPPPGQAEPGQAAQPNAATGGKAQNALPAAKLAKSSPITADRPKARRHAVALRKIIAPILAKAGDEVSAEVGMQLRGLHRARSEAAISTEPLNEVLAKEGLHHLTSAIRLADDAMAAARGNQPLTPPEVHAAIDSLGAPLADRVEKAADDSGLTNAQIAEQIAKAVSLRSLESLDAYGDLFEVANDSGGLAAASVGADGLTDQVYERAVAWAKERAATLVSLQGPDNIVQPTRDMIRDVIAKGLDDNIGAQKIADMVQASTAFSEERAALIANTEIANANGQGKLAGWQAAAETGLVLQKSWLTAGACCDDCAENEAAGPIDIDDDFPSGDDAEPAHPSCRCACVASEVPADETGE